MIDRFKTWTLAAVLVTLPAARVVAGQSDTTEIRRELADLRAEVQQLRAELDAVRNGRRDDTPALQAVRHTEAPPPGSPSGAETTMLQPSLELLQMQVSELSQVKVESASKMPVKVFGTIHMNAFLNSGSPNWLDNPNLVNNPPADGPDGSFSANMRQTRLGFTVDGPALNSFRTAGAVAFDFFGGIPGFATGQVMGLPRLATTRIPRAETEPPFQFSTAIGISPRSPQRHPSHRRGRAPHRREQ